VLLIPKLLLPLFVSEEILRAQQFSFFLGVTHLCKQPSFSIVESTPFMTVTITDISQLELISASLLPDFLLSSNVSHIVSNPQSVISSYVY